MESYTCPVCESNYVRVTDAFIDERIEEEPDHQIYWQDHRDYRYWATNEIMEFSGEWFIWYSPEPYPSVCCGITFPE